MSALKFQRTKSIVKPGFYRLTREAYHADMAPTPSLSSSLAKVIVNKSVAHAITRSPRFSGRQVTPTYAMDQGSAVHAFLAGDDAAVEIIPFHDWKATDAKRLRALAWRNGRTPILKPHVERLRECAEAARPVLVELMGVPASQWISEAALFWQGAGWRRGALDIVRDDLRVWCDAKTTDHDAAPRSAARALYDQDAHIQEGHYNAGLDALDAAGAGRRQAWFVTIERDDPFGIVVHETDATARSDGAEMARFAGEEWDRAVAAFTRADNPERPPSYEIGPHVAEYPTWKAAAWFDRKQGRKGAMQ